MTSYGLEELDEQECRELLASRHLGRIGIDTGDRPAILPVLYAVLDGDIVIRTAPGDKLIAAALHRVVPFEVDTHDDDAHTGWSVVAVGTAEELEHPDDLERAATLGLEPWAGAARDRYVRIRVEHISGRRIRPGEPA